MKRGVLWSLVSVLLLFSVSGLVFWDYTVYMGHPVSQDRKRQIKVVIPEGSTLTQVARILQDREIVKSPTYFRIYLLVHDVADQVKAGVYHFNTAQTPEEVSEELVRGPRTPFVVLTIKEGFNIWQVAHAFEEAGLAEAEDVLELLQDPAFAEQANVPAGPRADLTVSRLEGFIFPETYYVEPGQSLDRILMRMVHQFHKELREVKKKRLAQYSELLEEVGLTDHDIVTLASMVERETALPHEKRLVASVFLNRLKKQMNLQTDPTLTYSIERKGAPPTPEDRKNDANPYNTYAHPGFPPGPICSPGRDSLEAAVAPAPSAFLFFVAKRDGTGGHHFTTNYEDHKRAIKKYLKKGK
jgi:UPF0755 protein